MRCGGPRLRVSCSCASGRCSVGGDSTMMLRPLLPATARVPFAFAIAVVALLPLVAVAAPVYQVVDLSAGDSAEGGGANGVDAGRVVGSRRIGGYGHATVWPGFAAAPVDLNP